MLSTYVVVPGDPIAQLIFEKAIFPETVCEVNSNTTTVRGGLH